MKTYMYIKVYPSTYGGLELYSTDLQTLNWISGEVKKLVSSCRIEVTKDIAGEPYLLRLYKLQEGIYQVLAWILRQLCLNGWEPFAVNAPGEDTFHESQVYHFRREITAN